MAKFPKPLQAFRYHEVARTDKYYWFSSDQKCELKIYVLTLFYLTRRFYYFTV